MVRLLSRHTHTIRQSFHVRGRSLPGTASVLGLVLLALVVRLYGIDWDDGHLLHQDERAMLRHVEGLGLPSLSRLGVLLNAEESPWNPRWFPYGSLPLYLLKGVQFLATPIWDLDVVDLRIPGRALSAAAGVLTVLALYLLARDLSGRRVAFLATVLTALAVIHIQASHFYTVESLQTLFTVLFLWCLVRLVLRGERLFSILAGVLIALALATKVSSAPLALPFVLAHLHYPLTPGQSAWSSRTRRLAVALGVGGVTLLLVQPYAILDWHRFWAHVAEERDMVLRISDYPFTRQFIGTLPYVYHVRQIALFGLGLPVGALVWAGLLFAIYRAATRPEPAYLLVVAWAAAYLLIIGALPVKFLRYLLPVTPLLLLFAAQLLIAALDWSRARRPVLAYWVRAVIAITVAATALYAFAYLHIYSLPHPAVRAATWIESLNLSPSDVVLREHWNETLPGLEPYVVHELPMYDPDRAEKTELLVDLLAEARLLVISSSRLYGTIPRLPERYPLSSRFYGKLFQGELGYELVRVEASEPTLAGVVLQSDLFSRAGLPVPEVLVKARSERFAVGMGYADESFRVNDHPTVLVFQNTERLSHGELWRRLSDLSGRSVPSGP